MRSQIDTAFREPPTGHLERRVAAQIVQIVAIWIATRDGEDASAQNVRHGMGDLRRIAIVGDQCRQRVDQAKALVGARQQKNPSVGTDLAAIESSGDLLLADVWQKERKQGIVIGGGHGRFCPGFESGVDTQSLSDSRQLYHARLRIPAMR